MLTRYAHVQTSGEWCTTTNITDHKQGLSPTRHSRKSENRSIKPEAGEINKTILIKVKSDVLFCFALCFKCRKPLFSPPTSVPSLSKLYLVGPEQAVLSKTQQLHDSCTQKKTGTNTYVLKYAHV